MSVVPLYINFIELIRSLTWSLFHSLWIGMVAALGIILLQYLFKGFSARKRYIIFTSVFVFFFLLVLVKLLVELGKANFPVETIVISQESTVLILDLNYQQLAAFPLNSFIEFFNRVALYLFGVWGLIFLVKLSNTIWGQASELVSNSTSLAGSDLANWLEHEKTQLGIKTQISLYSSQRISSALVAGCVHPTIILPEKLVHELDPDQLQTIVLHELIHIKNKDHWFNAVQVFFETVFFFNPGFLWISETIREEREARCDSGVIERTNNPPLYLKTLVNAYEFSFHSTHQFLYFFRKKYEVLERVNRIMHIHQQKLDYRNLSLFAAGFFALFLLNPDFKSAPYHSQPTIPIQEKSKKAATQQEPLSTQLILHKKDHL